MATEKFIRTVTAHTFTRRQVTALGMAGIATLAASSAGLGPRRAAADRAQGLPLLAIIHTNDTHGHDVEVAATENDEGNFSMAAIPRLRADLEAQGYDVVVVDCGDATQGMPLVDQSRGEAAITFMNACGYDVMALGNHEFDRGLEEVDAYGELAEFPMISANILDARTGEPRFTPHALIQTTGGARVGFFGLTTPSTATLTKPEYVADVVFLGGEDLYACAQQQVDELRAQGADLVVCLGHLGNEQGCAPSTSVDVLEHVEGIDLFLDGHDHQLVEREVAGTLLVEAGCYLHNMGLVLIDEDAPSNQSMPYGTYDGVDAAAQAVIDEIDAQVDSELNVTLGHTDFFLDGNRAPGLRTQETNLGDLCADALLWDAGESSGMPLDAALVNSGGIRASIEEGDITLRGIKSVFAFSDHVVVLTVTGAQLLEALEAGYQAVGVGAIGAFPQVAGMEITIDTTVPYEEGELYPGSTFHGPANPGSRVTIHTVGGRAWSADDAYTVAIVDFMADGGDTYYPFKQAAEVQAPVICDFEYEALASYIIVACDHEVPAEYAEPQGRIQIL